MKRLILMAALFVVAVSSCKKKDDDDTTGGGNNGPTSPITAVPANFSPKVLLEEFTGAWCGYCPRGAFESDKLDSIQAGKFIPVAIHVGDIMKIALGESIDSVYNDYGYPGGMINRVSAGSSPTMATNLWSSKTNGT